jgi:hypothetical protein
MEPSCAISRMKMRFVLRVAGLSYVQQTVSKTVGTNLFTRPIARPDFFAHCLAEASVPRRLAVS